MTPEPATLSRTATAAGSGRRRLFSVLTPAVVVVVLVAALSACETRPTLRVGSRGSAVTTLQQRLTALHYDAGPVDGVFGDSTFHGVVAFQKVNGLARDGIVGPATWGALDRPFVPRPRVNPFVGGRYVSGLEVDLSRQVVYLTYLGTVTRILDASTGAGFKGSPYLYTPTGRFAIYRINPTGWEYGPLGALYKPAYFYRGFAIHGATSVPPYPASHGCVRTTIAARDRLTPWLWTGMPVNVYGTTAVGALSTAGVAATPVALRTVAAPTSC